MRDVLAGLFGNDGNGLRQRIVGVFGVLIGLNLAAWAAALVLFWSHPLLLGTAFLAYGFGLRHAVDADHIAAIDNVTRKLMQDGQRPVGVGFFFSFGHSTVVIIASMVIALTAATVDTWCPGLKEACGTIGTGVSALFLFVIAGINLLVLADVYRGFQRAKRGGGYSERDLHDQLDQRGLLARLYRPVMRLISASWHMYPLGFLFGLGFETATEIGLLSISAAQAASGLSIWTILVFPALFTAGMSLIDTADGVLMLGAYGWAYVKPIRKLYYNMTITAVSVLVALLVGGIEALGLLAGKLGLQGPLAQGIGEHFGVLGYGIIALFVLSWLLSTVIYRLKGYDAIEVADAAVPRE
jgi:nickel/cobalt transporter (NiCoT) family protein